MNWLQSRKQRKKLKKAGISEEAYRLLYFLSIRQEAVDIHKLVREAGSFREQETLYSISMTEYTVSVARTLLAKDLIHFSNRKFSISGAGLALVNSAGPPSRRLKRNPFMSTETCSSTTILANMLVSLLLLGSGIICRGYTLFAAGFVLLMYIGSYLYTWWGIRTRRDSMVSVQLPFLYYVFGIALLVLSASGVTVSLPLDHNVFANRITILAIVLMTALSVYQRKVGGRYISFSLLSLSRDSLRNAGMLIMVMGVNLASYFGFYYVIDGLVGIILSLVLLLHGFRLRRELRRARKNGFSVRTAMEHWFEFRIRRNRHFFFFQWLKIVLSERSFAKSELMDLYSERFRQRNTALFADIRVNLARDDYFEHMVDRALGELLFSHYCQIENDKFLHKK